MSSLLTSSSSSSPATGGLAPPFDNLLDVMCDVSVVLGTGAITVRRCLGLKRHSVLRLEQSAGEDLLVKVNGVILARGEVVIVEDSTAVRITEIPPPASAER